MKTLNVHNLVGICYLLVTIASALFIFSNLNKGIIWNDEAYYLLHFRDYNRMVTVDSTNYFRIFQIFYTTNLYKFRIITYILLNLSSFIAFFSSARFFSLKINPILFGVIGIACNYFTWQVTNVTLSQYFGNTVLINLALTSLFLFGKTLSRVYITICGFFLGLLCFNGIPHSIVIGTFLFYFFLVKPQQKRNLILLFLGLILGFLFYFLFIENFSTFISQFEFIKYYHKFHTKQHPKRFFLFWFLKVSGYIFFPAAIIWVLIRKNTNKRIILDIIALITGVGSFISHEWTPYVQYFLLLILVIRFLYTTESIQLKAAAITIFLIPFCLSFGSGAYFEVRSGAYMIYLILLIFILITKLYKPYVLIFMIPFLFLQCQVLINSYSTRGWKDYVVANQNIPVNIDGHTIYLDKERRKDLDDITPFIKNQKQIIYSSNHLMGYLYILHATPPVPYYFTLKDYLQFIIKKVGKTPDDFIYIENDEYRFAETDLHPLEFVRHPENYKVVRAGRFTLYLPQSFVKK